MSVIFYYYPADTMHVTILVLDGSLPDDVEARLAELRAVVGSSPGFDLTLLGLNVSRGTVFAQVSSTVLRLAAFGHASGRCTVPLGHAPRAPSVQPEISCRTRTSCGSRDPCPPTFSMRSRRLRFGRCARWR